MFMNDEPSQEEAPAEEEKPDQSDAIPVEKDTIEPPEPLSDPEKDPIEGDDEENKSEHVEELEIVEDQEAPAQEEVTVSEHLSEASQHSIEEEETFKIEDLQLPEADTQTVEQTTAPDSATKIP